MDNIKIKCNYGHITAPSINRYHKREGKIRMKPSGNLQESHGTIDMNKSPKKKTGR